MNVKISLILLWLVLVVTVLTTTPAHAFYNPQTGRWLNRDPLGESKFEAMRIGIIAGQSDGPNLNTFVHNNPVIEVDYLGLYGYGNVMPWQLLFKKFCEKPCSQGVGAEVVAELTTKGYTNHGGDTAQNAFRHCLATCRSAKKCGLNDAKKFWNGRENNGKTSANRMDLANNAVGFANSAKADCWDACKESWKNNEFKCLDKSGNLVPCPPPENGK